MKSKPIEAREYVVHGRVQGVGFRYFVQRCADQLSLGGWVKNRFDGAVEVYAVGSPDRLASLKQRLLAGPAMARVERVVEQPAAVRPETGFRIEF